MDIVPDGSTEGLVSASLIVIPALVVLWLRRPATPLPVGGPAVIAVSILALVVRAVRLGPDNAGGSFSYALISVLGVGAGLAWTGGRFGARASLSPLRRAALVVPGAVIAVWGAWNGGGIWIPAVAVAVISIAGPAADAVDDRLGGDGMTPSMVAVSAVGILVTLPETQNVAPVAGAMVVLAVLGWPLGLIRLGAGGGCAAVCILAALTVDGGWIRHGAIVGGLAAPGLLAALAVYPASTGDQPLRPGWIRSALLLALHSLVSLAVARVSGGGDDAWEATFSAVLFVLTGVLAAGPILSSGSLRR